MKHPYVISYLDSTTEDKESILLVTERCTPLELWIKSVLTDDSANAIEGMKNEAFWGIYCIATALDFLHSKCSQSHNFINFQSICVSQNGDWKLVAFDLSSNFNNQEDMQFLQRFGSVQPIEFAAPEREYGTYEQDIYSFAKCINKIFDNLGLHDSIPETLDRFLKRMMSVEPKRRVTASAILKCPELSSEYIQLLSSLNDLHLKTPLEAIDILNKILSKTKEFSKSVCNFKLLPVICQRLKMAINDFTHRDSRESSRQIIQNSVNLITTLAELGKLDESNYRSSCVNVFNDLWAMSDRTVRNSLLKSCKGLIPLTPKIIVNKNIFDAILAGFADSNAKMREETLKNLIYVVNSDKLEEKQMQDRLVRCVTNLQNDSEHSIRTNVTIFLGKISNKLKDGTRNKVLASSFAKAMRDPFIHCRIAALKATITCLSIIDVNQFATILLPQISLCLVDRHSEVRQLSLNLMEQGVKLMTSHHEHLMKLQVEEERIREEKKQNKDVTLSSSNTSGATSAWTSWAVDGITKTLERVSREQTMSNLSTSDSSDTSDIKSSDSVVTSTNNSNVLLEEEEEISTKVKSLSFKDDQIDSNKVSDWGDDDMDWPSDEEEDDEKPMKVIETKPSLALKTSVSAPILTNSKTTTNSNISNLSKSKAAPIKGLKLTATKLSSKDNDNWDDF